MKRYCSKPIRFVLIILWLLPLHVNADSIRGWTQRVENIGSDIISNYNQTPVGYGFSYVVDYANGKGAIELFSGQNEQNLLHRPSSASFSEYQVARLTVTPFGLSVIERLAKVDNTQFFVGAGGAYYVFAYYNALEEEDSQRRASQCQELSLNCTSTVIGEFLPTLGFHFQVGADVDVNKYLSVSMLTQYRMLSTQLTLSGACPNSGCQPGHVNMMTQDVNLNAINLRFAIVFKY